MERALLNGKERRVLVDSKIVYPYGVTIDYALEHVYWVETYLDFVERVNYDGSNRQTVRKGLSVSEKKGGKLFTGENKLHTLVE